MGKLRDTITGLWPVIKPYIPKLSTVLVAIVAFIIGLVWAYAIDPVKFYDADPSQLGQSWQDQWVRLVNDSLSYQNQNRDPSPEFDSTISGLLGAIDDPSGVTNALGLATDIQTGAPSKLGELANVAQPVARTAPEQPTLFGQIRPFLVGIPLIAIVMVVGSLLYGFYIDPMVVTPIRKGLRGSQGTDAAGAEAIKNIQKSREMAKQFAKDEAAAPTNQFGTPVVRHVSIYTPGRAYDDSFSIEDAAKDDEFLGECGVVISETIGAGQPEKVAAVEVWLFDKEDFVKTLTGVFASEYAASDPTTRAKLAQKGQVVVVKPGAVVMLETNTLRMQARVVDSKYGSGPLPPNSYFDGMTIELQAWRKTGAAPVIPSNASTPAIPAFSAPASSPAAFAPPPPSAPPAFSAPPSSGMPAFSAPPPSSTPPAFAPPPSAPRPSFSAPPSFGGGAPSPSPFQPPPPRKSEDDPFGGTGDFTPVN